MSMKERDVRELQRMVAEYCIDDVIKTLINVIDQQADQLVDLGLNERAKGLTRVSWHMDNFLAE